MENPKDLAATYRNKLDRMREVTAETEYETGLTVCDLKGDPGSEHAKQPVLGTKNNTGGSQCEPGTTPKATIHTHNRSPPSRSDLRELVNEEESQCVIMNGLQENKGKMERTSKDQAVIACMSVPENINKQKVQNVARPKKYEKDHFKQKDVQNLEKAGVNVETYNLKSYNR